MRQSAVEFATPHRLAGTADDATGVAMLLPIAPALPVRIWRLASGLPRLIGALGASTLLLALSARADRD